MSYEELDKTALAETAGLICDDDAIRRLKEAILWELKGQIPMDDPDTVKVMVSYVAASLFANVWLDGGPELTKRNVEYGRQLAHVPISALLDVEIGKRLAKKGGR